MKKHKNGILLTIKESEKIADLLNTLAAMSGSYDQYFTRDCKAAGRFAEKIEELVEKNDNI